MKNKILVVIFIFILLANFVLANSENMNKESKNFTKKEFKQELNQASEKEITLPKYVSLPLGIKEGNIGIHYLIIMGTFIFILFIIFFNIYQFIPFFENKLLVVIASLVSILLLSFTGIIKDSAIEFFGFWNFFDFLKDWTILKIIVSVILSLFLLVGFLKLIHWLKRDYELTEAEFTGMKVGLGLKLIKDKSKIERAKIDN